MFEDLQMVVLVMTVRRKDSFTFLLSVRPPPESHITLQSQPFLRCVSVFSTQISGPHEDAEWELVLVVFKDQQRPQTHTAA